MSEYAGEVEVQLEGEAQRGRPAARQAEAGVVQPEVVHVGGEQVGEEQLLGHAHGEEVEAGAGQTRGEPRLQPDELLVDVGVAHDGAGDEVREHRDEGGVVHVVLRRPHRAAVDVDGIRHRVERVERDADRQHDAQHGQRGRAAEEAGDAVQLVHEEPGVLEVAQERQVHTDGDGEGGRAHPPVGGAHHHLAGDPVRARGGKQHRQVAPVPVGIEDVGRDRQEGEAPRGRPQQPVDQQRDRQEGEEEDVAVEEHGRAY